MALFRNKRNIMSPLIEVSIKDEWLLDIHDHINGLQLLRDFFKLIRPPKSSDVTKANVRMQEAIILIKEHPTLNKNLRSAFLSQLINTDIVPALTDSGVLLSKGFWQEFTKRFNQKFLPALQSEKDILYVLNRIFYKKYDYMWVESIRNDAWAQIFTQVGLDATHSYAGIQHQLLAAMEILSYRIVSPGIDQEMLRYMPDMYLQNNPFILQNQFLLKLKELHHTQQNDYQHEIAVDNFRQAIDKCVACLEEIREVQRIRGANLSLSYSTLGIQNTLHRMMILFDAVDNDNDINMQQFVSFFKELVRNEKRKNSIRELISKSFSYVAYSIAEHKGTKGSKYITSTWKEYIKMLVAAMWGGFIICFVGIIKSIISLFHLHPIMQGFANSINYSAGFVMIEETHSALATKQPAFTASAVASSFDKKKNGRPNLYMLAVTVGKIFRSQVASFIGNLIVVFPVTYFFAYLYDKITGYKLVSGAAAYELLKTQHPFQSFSLIYACNTGFFLFLSGLIAGYFQNSMQYSNVGLRIQAHPLLSNYFSKEKLGKVGNYIQNHLGSIIGNVALGLFLGMSSIVPKLTGINFDIRHVTISSANVSIGTYGIGLSNITWDYLLIVVLGVLGIGFFNFVVSFFLAFIVAVRSRNVKLKDYPEFLRILSKYFVMQPLNFIIPPGAKKTKALRDDK